MQELLEKLKSLDPTTYAAFEDTELGEYNCYDDYGKMTEYIYQDGLINKAQMAWLQACLQEAISGYKSKDFLQDRFWKIEYLDTNTYRATIYDRVHRIAEEDASLPAKSLLAAYIAACEATHDST